MYGGVLLFPNEEMPFEVAATTWTNLLGCKKYEGKKTLEAIARLRQGDLGPLRRRAGPGLHLHRPDPEEARKLSRPVAGRLAARRAVGGEEASGVVAG